MGIYGCDIANKSSGPVNGRRERWRKALGIWGLSVFLGGAGCPGVAGAWGPEGHILVAEIAQRRLSAETRQVLQREFNITRLSDVANWADQIKSKRRETRPWHYTNIPQGETNYLKHRDCPTGDCVTEKIPEFLGVLDDPTASRKQQVEALKFLVHFVADVHQPMHLGNPGDRGGNEIRLRWGGEDTNLHAVWDHDLIRSGNRPLSEYAAELERAIVPSRIRESGNGIPVDWSLESRRLALEAAYPVETDAHGELTPAYIARGRAVVQRRLQQAGLRLADLLNHHLQPGRK